jgi:ABC-type lipoprotein release transport system permease subunit
MGAVGYRFRAQLRPRWAATLVLVVGALLVALAVAETPARHAARVRPALVLRAK